MKIRFLSGKRQGEISHAPYSQETKLMIDAGLIEEIPLPARGSAGWLKARMEQEKSAAPTPAHVSWGIHKGTQDNRITLEGKCSRPNCSIFRFEGKREFLSRHTFQHCCGAYAEAVPLDVIKKYAEAKKSEEVHYTADEAALFRYSSHVGDSNKHREVK